MTEHRRSLGALIATLLAAAVVLTACGGGSTAARIDPGTGRADELTMQFTGPPTTLDPSQGGTGGSSAFVSLAYDPLIYLDREGKYVPDLATSWKFTDKTYTEFRLELRRGVTFSTGEKLTPAAVKKSIQYFLAGSYAANAGPVKSVEADSKGITIHYSSAFPDAPLTLTQEYRMGNIISPDGVDHPKELLKTSYGTGQYVLDAGETIGSSEYVYQRNPHYWNPSAQQYEKVSIKIITDPNAVVSAVTTGQVDIAAGNSTTYDVASSSDLELPTVDFYNWALFLADMKGSINPALAEPKVRQAIAMSIDRGAIANAISPQLSVANGQIMNKGTEGYVDGLDYGYDPDKARSLLAEAGYPDGFSMTILTQNTTDAQTVRSQAIADYLRKIGIDVHLKVITTGIANFTQEALSKKYEAVIFPVTGTTMGNVQRDMLTHGSRNPFGYSDPQIQKLYTRALTAGSAKERTTIYEEMSRRQHDLAYVIPVFTAKTVQYVSSSVTNVSTTVKNPTFFPIGPTKALSWQPKGE